MPHLAVHPSPPRLPSTFWHSSGVGKGLLAIATLFFVKEAEPVLVPMTVAIVLTFVLARPLRMLHRLGLPIPAAAAVLVCALLGSAVLVAASLALPAAKWWERAPTTAAQLLEQLERVRDSLPRLRRPAAPVTSAGVSAGDARRRTPSAALAASQRAAEASAPPSSDTLGNTIAAEGLALTRLVLGRFMSFGVSTAATVMLLFFLLCSEHWIVSRTVEALKSRHTRARVLVAVRRAQQDIGHFLGAVAIINVGVGVVTGMMVWMLGLENPFLWGTLAAMLNFVPYLGPAVTVALLGLAGVVSFQEATDMAAPAFAFMAIHFVESNFVTTWFIGRRLALSPVVVFASVMWMGWLWGVAGAMLTVPLLIGVRSSLRCVRSMRPWCVMLEGSSDGVPSLSSLLRLKRRRPALPIATR